MLAVILFVWFKKQKTTKIQHRERETVYVCVCVCVCACVPACVCACVCACVLDGEGNRVLGSRAVVVVQMAVYLTSYNSHLPSFCEHFCHLIDVTLV